MQYLFISDLHLSAAHPRLVDGFLRLLAFYQPQQTTALYILGDWFNAWLDDRDDSAWLQPIVAALNSFTTQGHQVYFLCGNRDFVLGQGFMNRFGGHLIQEPYVLTLQNKRIRLEHGDALCIDDVSYQRFKKIIRHPLVLNALKLLPFSAKQKLADFFRQQSADKQQQAQYRLVDVNAAEVARQMKDVDVLIHGHTHRPQIEHLANSKLRIVLSDWNEHSGSAEILLLHNTDDIALTTWRF